MVVGVAAAATSWCSFSSCSGQKTIYMRVGFSYSARLIVVTRLNPSHVICPEEEARQQLARKGPSELHLFQLVPANPG